MATLPVFLRSSITAVLSSWALAIAAHPAQANDPISNGGFETGDFSGWTVSGLGTNSLAITNDSVFIHEGDYGAIVGAQSQGLLSQTFSLNKKQAYKLTYSLKANLQSEGSAPSEPSYFVVSMNGKPIAGGSVSSKDFKVHQVIFNPREELTEIQFTLIGNKGTIALDDVSLERVNTGAPPPFLLGAGAAAAGTGAGIAGGEDGGQRSQPTPNQNTDKPKPSGVVKPFPNNEVSRPGNLIDPPSSQVEDKEKEKDKDKDKDKDKSKEPEPVPTPALLPALIGFGWRVIRQRRQEAQSDSAGS